MRFLAVLLILANLAFCESVSVKYIVKFGIFGEIGVADATLVKDETTKTYEITLDAKTTGITNSLSGNRREYFCSKGKIIGDLLVPEIYTHEVNRNKKGKMRIERKIFTFNHTKKIVNLKREKGYKDEKLEITSNENLEYFAQNDLLSLFFNFSKLKFSGDKFYTTAVGAKNENGRIDIIIPQNEQKIAIKKELKSKFDPYIVFINQKIFSSSKGELYLSLDERGYANKAILKDVLFFGDIIGEIK
nr:DUF3108 domain-containing protein [Campylobacter sp.]